MTNIPVGAGELTGLDYLNELARGHWRKTTVKDVNTTTTATDLLNGEITIDAGAMGSTRAVRATLLCDILNNSGGTANAPQFQLKLAGTTLIDTGAGTNYLAAGVFPNSATRLPFLVELFIQNQGSASVQYAMMRLAIGASGPAVTTGIGALSNSFVWATAGTTAVNTANAAALVFNTINASASASYSVRLQTAFVEVV